MFKFRSNSGQKCSPEPEQKCSCGTGTGIPVDLCSELTHMSYNLKTELVVGRTDFEHE